MQAQSSVVRQGEEERGWALEHIASFHGLRALAWSGNILYASRGYTLLRANFQSATTGPVHWEEVAHFHPCWWRARTVCSGLTARLFRDGFHALAVLPSGSLVAAVPGAVIEWQPAEKEFRVSHRITRGTRPLHIAVTPDGNAFWGEYFDNPKRDAVYIYRSSDQGRTWSIAYTFAPGEIRHVHNIVYDRWENCLWILTGDYGNECRIVRASMDFKRIEAVIAGNQQARAVAIVPTSDALYFASDTPLEGNHVYRLDRAGRMTVVADLNSSSIYGCLVDDKIFFSTMVEPSKVNSDQHVRLYGATNGFGWNSLLSWKKDFWSMRFFQYGNAFLPDGSNTSGLLAVTTIAVKGADLHTTIFEPGSIKSADRYRPNRML
jgi:hypothetical protein